MDNHINNFVELAGKSNQPAIEITGKPSDDWKFDLLDVIDFGLKVVVGLGTAYVVLFSLFVWWRL